jgi:hypothetical protein
MVKGDKAFTMMIDRPSPQRTSSGASLTTYTPWHTSKLHSNTTNAMALLTSSFSPVYIINSGRAFGLSVRNPTKKKKRAQKLNAF